MYVGVLQNMFNRKIAGSQKLKNSQKTKYQKKYFLSDILGNRSNLINEFADVLF